MTNTLNYQSSPPPNSKLATSAAAATALIAIFTLLFATCVAQSVFSEPLSGFAPAPTGLTLEKITNFLTLLGSGAFGILLACASFRIRRRSRPWTFLAIILTAVETLFLIFSTTHVWIDILRGVDMAPVFALAITILCLPPAAVTLLLIYFLRQIPRHP